MAEETEHLATEIRGLSNITIANKRSTEETFASFKQQAANENGSMANFAKDLNSFFASQKNETQNLTDAVESSVTETENVARKIDNTNQLLQNSINIQRQMLGELSSVSGTLNDILTEEKSKEAGGGGGSGLLGNAVGAASALSELKGLFRILASPAGIVTSVAALTALTTYLTYNNAKEKAQNVNNSAGDYLDAKTPEEKAKAKEKLKSDILERSQAAANASGAGIPVLIPDNQLENYANQEISEEQKRRGNNGGPDAQQTQNSNINNAPAPSSQQTQNNTGGTSSRPSGTYSASSAAQLAKQAGATPEEAKILGAIAMAESSGKPQAHNGKAPDNSYGLWQINLYGRLAGRVKEFGLNGPEDLYDPQNNAKAAVRLLRQQGFKAWSTYSSGKYKKYLNETGNDTGTSAASPQLQQSAGPSVTPITSGSAATGGSKPTVTNQQHPEMAAGGKNENQGGNQVSSPSPIPGASGTGGATGGATDAKKFIQSRQGGGRGFAGVNADKLNSGFAQKMMKAISAAEAATGDKIMVTEGYRDSKIQAQYYANYKQTPIEWEGKTYYPQKKGGIAAKPGNSKHQRGLAVDISRGKAHSWLAQNASRFGIKWGGSFGDPPHFEDSSGGSNEYQEDNAQKVSGISGGGQSAPGPMASNQSKNYPSETQEQSGGMPQSSGEMSGGMLSRGMPSNPMAMIGKMLGGVIGGGKGAMMGGMFGSLLSAITSPAPGALPQQQMAGPQQSAPQHQGAEQRPSAHQTAPKNKEGVKEHDSRAHHEDHSGLISTLAPSLLGASVRKAAGLGTTMVG